MFAQPGGRIAWPLLWFFVAPLLAILLWQVAAGLMSGPDPVWGGLSMLLIAGAVAWLPVQALRRSMAADHTAGIVIAVLVLGWALMLVAAIGGLAGWGDGSTSGAVADTPVQAEPAAPRP